MDSQTQTPPRPVQVASATCGGWRGYWWLLAGAALSMLAVGGHWDVSIAGWLAAIPLLMFTRTRGPVVGSLWVFAVSVVAGCFWLFETGQGFDLPLIGMVSIIGAILTLPYLFDRLVQHRLSPLWATLVFPTTRVASEYLDALINPAGNIYGSLAATQHDLQLLQVASIVGAYGVSFLLAWFASSTVTALQRRTAWRRVAATFGLVLLAVVGAGSARLAFLGPTEQTVRVAAITPKRGLIEARDDVLMTGGKILGSEGGKKDISPLLRERYTAVNDDLIATTEQQAREGAKVIVWPEGGGATTTADRAVLLERVGAIAKQYQVQVNLAFGEFTDQPPYMRNEAVLINSDGKPVWTYDKAHLAPSEPYTPGDGDVPTVDTPGGRLGNLICFDADFPGTARDGARKEVDMMLVPSNDWREFGPSHTDKAGMRAIENGYSLVRADVGGVSRIYDPQGRTLAESSYYGSERAIAAADVPVHGERTLYGAAGDVFAWVSVAGMVALLCVGFTRQPRW